MCMSLIISNDENIKNVYLNLKLVQVFHQGIKKLIKARGCRAAAFIVSRCMNVHFEVLYLSYEFPC